MLSWLQDLSKMPRVKGGSAVKICVDNSAPSPEALPSHGSGGSGLRDDDLTLD